MVSKYERRSLFLHVTRAEAEVSIVASLKYLVNHFFEMYGIEVSIETQPGTVQLEFITG